MAVTVKKNKERVEKCLGYKHHQQQQNRNMCDSGVFFLLGK